MRGRGHSLRSCLAIARGFMVKTKQHAQASHPSNSLFNNENAG